jgi:hypothetical protein
VQRDKDDEDFETQTQLGTLVDNNHICDCRMPLLSTSMAASSTGHI